MTTLAAQPVAPQASPSPRRTLTGIVAAMALIGALAVISPLLAGAVYVPFFLALAWTRPEYALALVLAAAPFPNDLSVGGPVRFSLAEINLALLLPVYVLRRGPRPMLGPAGWAIALYFAVCIVASLGNLRQAAIVSLAQMFVYMVVAVSVFAGLVKQPEKLFMPLYVAAIVGGVFAIVGLATRFHAFGIHKNSWGASLSSVLILTLELWFNTSDRKRKRWLTFGLAVMAIALVSTVSRGGWIAAMSGALVLAAMRKQYKMIARASILLIPCVAIAWFLLPDATKDYAVGFDSSRWNVKARYESAEFALENFRSSPLLGKGVGLRKEFDATNIVLTVLAETGVVGLISFALIHLAGLVGLWRTAARMGTQHPLFPLVALGSALLLARLLHGLVDHYWSRGAVTPAWCAVGMANAAYYYVRRRPKTAART
jgi:O-antigen ligase